MDHIKNRYILCDNDRPSSTKCEAYFEFESSSDKPDDWIENEKDILKIVSSSKQFRDDGMRYRVAKCLLGENKDGQHKGEKHNGFVAIFSEHRSNIDDYIKLAGEFQKIKPMLAGDHFDSLVCLPLWLVRDVYLERYGDEKDKDSAYLEKKRSAKDKKCAEESLINFLNIQFIMMESYDHAECIYIEYKFQLRSFIKNFTREREEELLQSSAGHFLLVGMNRFEKMIKLNLPGGKRHLGETSFEAAVRELYEETSLFLPYQSYGKKGGDKTFIDVEDGLMRFFLAKPTPVTHCTCAVQLLPDFVSRERCRMCIQKKKKTSKDGNDRVSQSRKGCLKCKEIICRSCFITYDHTPSKRPAVKRQKKLHY